MHEFITKMEPTGSGPTLAVKDLIDVVGVPTTAGSKAVALGAGPASADAPLMRGARQADARIVGKANLYELAFGASGVNPHFGTPVNPLDPTKIPGGSSSGSAVAVANGVAEIAYGSDSGGSIRVPAAFCGIAGLKTTLGRIPVEGVYPLAPSLDTVGPMANDVDGLIVGMQLLEPGFSTGTAARSIGLVHATGVSIDPKIAQSIDRLCKIVALHRTTISLPQWMHAFDAGSTILHFEAVISNRHLIDDPDLFPMLSSAVRDRLAIGSAITNDELQKAITAQRQWQRDLDTIFAEVDVMVLPSVGFFPPLLEEAFDHTYTHLTMPFNLAGYPAVSIPVPCAGPFPASLQLLGPAHSEEMLLATALVFERAAATVS